MAGGQTTASKQFTPLIKSLPVIGKDTGLLFSQRKANASCSHSGMNSPPSRNSSPPRPLNHHTSISIPYQDKFNSQEDCPHLTPESVDNFIAEAISIASNSSHYHTLAKLLTPTHASCLLKFKVTKIQSHLHSNCYLKKRLAQATFLNTRSKNHERWFPFEWTLLMICQGHKVVSRRLHPHQRYKRFSLLCKLKGFPIHADLISNYGTDRCELNRELLRRQVAHLRKTSIPQLSFRSAITLIQKQIKRATRLKTLPRLPWVNEKLLDPQNLLLHGKKILKNLKLASFGVDTCTRTENTPISNEESKFSIRVANIRSLTREKLQIDRATESLLGTTPDVYIYVESRFKPSGDMLQKYRHVFHSSAEEGRGGTTILVKKDINVSFSETNVPDTVILVLHRCKTTLVLAGTYLSQRVTDKLQKLRLILETLGKLTERFVNPSVLLFGDLNMNVLTVERAISSLDHQLAHLRLRVADNYSSPT